MVSSNILMTMSSDECHRTCDKSQNCRIMPQNWWYHQNITWTSFDQDLQRHLASLGPNELTFYKGRKGLAMVIASFQNPKTVFGMMETMKSNLQASKANSRNDFCCISSSGIWSYPKARNLLYSMQDPWSLIVTIILTNISKKCKYLSVTINQS